MSEEETGDACEGKGDDVYLLRGEVHTCPMVESTHHEQAGGEEYSSPIVWGSAVKAYRLLEMTIHESETEEEDAPGFADATLHYRHFQPPRDLEESEAEGAEGDKECCAPPFQPRELAVSQSEEYQEEDARHQQGTEEPESAGEELVVAAHAEDDVYDTLESDLEGIGMCDTAGPVAVGLVEDTHGEH